MKKIEVYTTQWCPYCEAAKRLLTEKNLTFEVFDVTINDKLRQETSQRAGGYQTVPMIFIDGIFIGGFTELQALNNTGSL